MMKLTLLANLLLVSVVLAACPTDNIIPNLIAGMSRLTQIRCKSQSPSPEEIHPKVIHMLWQKPSPQLHQSPSVFLSLPSPSRLLDVVFRTSRFLHIPQPNHSITHCLLICIYNCNLVQGALQLLGFRQQ